MQRPIEIEGEFAVHGAAAPFCGRTAELAAIEAALERAVRYQAPQIALVMGAQGVGKSRLVSVFSERVIASPRPEGEPAVRVYSGRATERGPAYGVFAKLLRHRFDLMEGAEAVDGEEPRERFRAEVARVFADKRVTEVLHFLGGFVGLRFPDNPFLRAVEEDPAQHDRIARTVLRRFFEVDAERSPLVLVLDDLQWADDPSLTLLRELGQALAGSPVVILAAARPDLLSRDPNFGSGLGELTRIELRNLAPPEAGILLRALLRRAGEVPAAVVDHAVDVTSGNPFFLEELVRVFIARGAIEVNDDGWRLDVAKAQAVDLPISVEEAIAARIASLSADERLLLERALTLGSVFWTGALVALARSDEASTSRDEMAFGDRDAQRATLARVLAGLVDADYLLRMPDATIAGEEEYAFKHNLEREHLVRSLESERARRYHLSAAQWLDHRLPASSERTEEQLEFLAQLYERGGRDSRAAGLYLAAADQARARYANREALALYEKGLRLADPEDSLGRLDALHNAGDVCALIGRSDEAAGYFRALLCAVGFLDPPPNGAAAHVRLGRLLRQQGDLGRAYEHLQAAHPLFLRAGDRRGVAATLDEMGRIHWLKGSSDAAFDLYRQALALRRELGDRRSIALSLNNLGLAHKDAGELDAGGACFLEALGLRREIGDRSGVASSLCALGGLLLDRKETAQALVPLQEALGIDREIGDRIHEGEALAALAEALVQAGRYGEAMADVEQARELARALGDRLLLVECERITAEALLGLGQIAQAASHAAQAAELAEWAASPPQLGSALRVLAEVSAAGGFGDEGRGLARARFERAVELFEKLQNRPALVRCLDRLAGYLTAIGETSEAARATARAREVAAGLSLSAVRVEAARG